MFDSRRAPFVFAASLLTSLLIPGLGAAESSAQPVPADSVRGPVRDVADDGLVPRRASLAPRDLVARGAGGGATYLTATDNQNNGGTNVADGDMGGGDPPFLFDTDALHPIEFDIDVTGSLPTTSAQLLIEAWDVDETSGQVDEVYFNGNLLGTLTGADGQFSTTSFDVPIGQVVAGRNLVEILVDEDPPGQNNVWGLTVQSGQLLIDGGGASDASCRSLTVGEELQFGGAPAQIEVEVDTVLGSQTVRVEVNLLDGNGVNVSGAVVTGTISGGADDALATALGLIDSRAAGSPTLEALIFDDATGLFQDRCELPLSIRAGCATFEDLQQPLGLLFTTRTSDVEAGFEVSETMIDATNVLADLPGPLIRRLRWWGQSLEYDGNGFIGGCTEDDVAGTPFELGFYADDAGAPGALLATRTVAADEILATGVSIFGDPVRRFTATFEAVDSAGVRWISIRRQAGPLTLAGNPCYFLWGTEGDTTQYDDLISQRDVSVPSDTGLIEDEDTVVCVDASSIFLDGFESGDTSAW